MFLSKNNKVNSPDKINILAKKVMLFTNARNEIHIKEWAAHHLLIGFDKIIIFDHKSDIPLKTVLHGFDKRVITMIVLLHTQNINIILQPRIHHLNKDINSNNIKVKSVLIWIVM
jgi:hypothetical protein